MKKKGIFISAAVALLCSTAASSAATITLNLVASYDRTSPFGLAFDGNNIWWSDGFSVIHEMTTSGVDTGNTFTGPIWGELAWNGSQLMQTHYNTIYYFNRDGSGQTTSTITAGNVNDYLIDGFDYDHGELWISPDVAQVERLSGDGSSTIGPSPFLSGSGGYSGVERIQATDGTDYVVVVNDATSPRQLCVHNLDASQVGCQSFANARYEGLAFDGRYVWAADYYGNKIDKYDILGAGGGSIIDPGGNPGTVPLPAGFPLLASAVVAMGIAARRKKRG